MTSEYDKLFAGRADQAEEYERRRRAQEAAEDERRAVWQQIGGQLTSALQPIADAASAHGHAASVTRDERGEVVFELVFRGHPDEPVRCSFFCSYPPDRDALLYIDFNGPGRWDDPLDPVRQPLGSFTVESGCERVTDLIRSASKLLL
jgi:hypothetical protein